MTIERSCTVCGREALRLIGTATHAWFGCPYCHHTWDVDIEASGTGHEVASQPNDQWLPHRPAWQGYVVAVLATSLALVLRIVLRPVLGNASPFLLFTPAVAIAAIYGGLVPGVLTTFLSTFLGSHFLLIDPGEPVIEKWDRVILFVIVGTVIAISASLLQRSRQQLAASLWREQKARAAAEAADRSKDDFLALISHELRTPLSVVLGWLSVARQQRTNENAFRNAVDAVERNAQILSRLVDDVFDRSRIVTGRLRLDQRLISLTTAVQAAVDQMRTRIESADLHLHVSIPSVDLFVLGDSIRLQQVFTNLLSNAMKFTAGDGHISVQVVRTERSAQVALTDTGVGISRELLPHIFEPFRQGQAMLGPSSQGLGLGLAIARDLIEQHEGTIVAASDGPGCGTTFTITLPLVQRTHVSRSKFDEHRGKNVRASRAIH